MSNYCLEDDAYTGIIFKEWNILGIFVDCTGLHMDNLPSHGGLYRNRVRIPV